MIWYADSSWLSLVFMRLGFNVWVAVAKHAGFLGSLWSKYVIFISWFDLESEQGRKFIIGYNGELKKPRFDLWSQEVVLIKHKISKTAKFQVREES